jgi:hypothetical protein
VAILSGARNYRQAVLSERLYNRMNDLFPEKKEDLIAASILVSNTYLSLGDDQQAEKIRLNRIEKFGKHVRAGLSWTEVNGQLLVKNSFHIHLKNVSKFLFVFFCVKEIPSS